MSFRLKLTKALSYTGIVSASKGNPYVDVEDKATAEKAVATGYFEIAAEENPEPENTDKPMRKSLEKMNISELETFAVYNNVDIKGITKKADIISKLETELNISKTDEVEYGSPTMTGLQES